MCIIEEAKIQLNVYVYIYDEENSNISKAHKNNYLEEGMAEAEEGGSLSLAVRLPYLFLR